MKSSLYFNITNHPDINIKLAVDKKIIVFTVQQVPNLCILDITNTLYVIDPDIDQDPSYLIDDIKSLEHAIKSYQTKKYYHICDESYYVGNAEKTSATYQRLMNQWGVEPKQMSNIETYKEVANFIYNYNNK